MPSWIKILTIPFGMIVGLTCSEGQSVLNSGQWFQFSVASDGVVKIDYSLLKKAGVNPDQINPANIQIYAAGNGMLPQPNNAPRSNALKQIAIQVQGEADGKFDPDDVIFFWAQGSDTHYYNASKEMFYYGDNIYSDKNYYYLTIGSQAGKRIVNTPDKGTGFPVVHRFEDFGFYQTDKYSILKSGREWYGEQFDSKLDITVRFDVSGISSGSTIKFVSAVMAQAFSGQPSFDVIFNTTTIGNQKLELTENTTYAIKGTEALDTLTFPADAVAAPGQDHVDIKYHFNKLASDTSTGYLNYFLFSLRRDLALYGNQTVFVSAESLSQPVSQFEVNNIGPDAVIWNITNPWSTLNQVFARNGNLARFATATDSLQTFVAFNTGSVSPATFEKTIDNQNLAGMAAPDLLIIVHPDLLSEAQRLADHRRSWNQLDVQVVTPQQIYNEYSSGKQDPTAIRDFVRDLYIQPGSALKNLLLFGRCSYDYKQRVPYNTNLVPTYESRNSLGPLETYSSDDYFAFLETSEGTWPEDMTDHSTMDIGTGRISVVTLTDAGIVVDKLIDYDKNQAAFGPWRQTVLFAADDGDVNVHQSQANQLATLIDNSHGEFVTKKVYLDNFKQIETPTGQQSPRAREALDQELENGVGFVNFTGHGSQEVWTEERILDGDLIKGLKNGPKYPFFITATCEFGRHDDPFQISSAEQLMMRKGGGAIGLVTTARPVSSSTNFDLNKAFYNALFTTIGGQYRDIGSIFLDTKNNSISGVANRNFSLLGDPSMNLAMPQNQIVVNEIKTATQSDTIKALSTVTVKGEVQRLGVLRSDFQGEVSATLFDRRATFTTRGDENTPFTYTSWSTIIFRGRASVSNGTFQFMFVVPKDVESTVAAGKVVLYADNEVENAAGMSAVPVGGIETAFPADNTPPDMTLYIGDTTFLNGGIANPNTQLLVRLHDAHGIAISGLNSANDLIAVLDDSLTYVMNDFYSADKDDFTHGAVALSLKNLPSGSHHIVVQASDTYGNRSTASVDFFVNGGGLLVSDFHNYPNPFASLSESTTLEFTHNRPGEDLDIEFNVYDIAGGFVASQHYSVTESYSRVTLTEWSGSSASGIKLSNGLYLGKLSVRSLLDGSKNERITKLIVLN